MKRETELNTYRFKFYKTASIRKDNRNFHGQNLQSYQKLVTLKKFKKMKNTSISLGNYFDQFVSSQVAAGRYKNVSEVVQAGLRLLEDEENKVIALRNAIQEGIDSGIAHDFDPKKNLENLKARRTSNGSI